MAKIVGMIRPEVITLLPVSYTHLDVYKRQVVLQNTNDQTADHIEQHDNDAGNRITANEFRGTVHRTKDIGFT